MVDEPTAIELPDITQLISRCPSKVQVEAVIFDDISSEKLGNDGNYPWFVTILDCKKESKRSETSSPVSSSFL